MIKPFEAKLSRKHQFDTVSVDCALSEGKIAVLNHPEITTIILADATVDIPVGKSDFIIISSSGDRLVIQYQEDLKQYFSQRRHNSFERVIYAVEQKASYIAGLLLGSLLTLCLAYLYGLPLLVFVTKPLVGESTKLWLGNNIYRALEKNYLQTSTLTLQQKAQITDSLAAVATDLGIEPPTLYFHQSSVFGANALALLPDKIILTDQIVSILNPAELSAVLTHEIGHLYYDHSTESLLRYSYLTVFAGMVLGFEPGTIQLIATRLIESANSREHERQADEMLLRLGAGSGITPADLISALDKIAAEQGLDSDKRSLLSYASTHPTNQEREDNLRNKLLP